VWEIGERSSLRTRRIRSNSPSSASPKSCASAAGGRHEAVIQQRDAGLAGERDLVLEQLAGGLVGLGLRPREGAAPALAQTRPGAPAVIALRIVTRGVRRSLARSSSLWIETPTG